MQSSVKRKNTYAFLVCILFVPLDRIVPHCTDLDCNLLDLNILSHYLLWDCIYRRYNYIELFEILPYLFAFYDKEKKKIKAR